MSNWNDGGALIGTRKIKVYPPGAVDGNGSTTYSGTTKGIYVLEGWTPSRGALVMKRYDEVHNPNAAAGQDDFVEASGVAQIANAAAVLLDNGDAFTTKRHLDTTGGSDTAESWVITSVDEPEEQGGMRKQSFRAQKIVSATGPTVYP